MRRSLFRKSSAECTLKDEPHVLLLRFWGGLNRMRSHIIARIDLDQHRLGPDLDYLASVPRVEEEYDEFSSGY